MSESAPTLIAVDPNALRGIESKLDQILSERSNSRESESVEWITRKSFMDSVSIKAYNTFYKIESKIPESLKREINGKNYVHRDCIKKYFEGAFNE
jgi:hypothetical protein